MFFWNESGTKILAVGNSSFGIAPIQNLSTIKYTTFPESLLNSNSLDISKIFASKWDPHNENEIYFSANSSLFGWDIKSSKEIFIIPNAHENLIRCIDVNPNKPHQIVSGADDCQIKLWDTRNVRLPIKQFSHHSHWIQDVSFNKFHDQLILSCSSDHQVNLHSIISISSAANIVKSDNESENEIGSEIPEDGIVACFEQHQESVYSVKWSNADPWIFASLSYDGLFAINFVPSIHKYKIIL